MDQKAYIDKVGIKSPWIRKLTLTKLVSKVHRISKLTLTKLVAKVHGSESLHWQSWSQKNMDQKDTMTKPTFTKLVPKSMDLMFRAAMMISLSARTGSLFSGVWTQEQKLLSEHRSKSYCLSTGAKATVWAQEQKLLLNVHTIQAELYVRNPVIVFCIYF